MSQEIFHALQEIEQEADAIVQAARDEAGKQREGAALEGQALLEEARNKMEAMRRSLDKEAEAESARLRTEAKSRLDAEVMKLRAQADQGFADAVAEVVKECLDHGRR